MSPARTTNQNTIDTEVDAAILIPAPRLPHATESLAVPPPPRVEPLLPAPRNRLLAALSGLSARAPRAEARSDAELARRAARATSARASMQAEFVRAQARIMLAGR